MDRFKVLPRFAALRARVALATAMAMLASAAPCETAPPPPSAGFTSIKACYDAWLGAGNEADRKAARDWIETRARMSVSQKELGEAIMILGRIAATDGSGATFLALCAERARDADPALRQTVILQTSDWQASAGDHAAALATLSGFLSGTDPTPADRAIATRKAAVLLADNLGRPVDAAKLLADAMALVTTNSPAAFADLGIARADLMSKILNDPAAAEADLRRVLALGTVCPQAQFQSASDQLAAILAATGRAGDVPEVLMSVLRRSPLPTAGFARKLAESGASVKLLEEALVLLRRGVATAVPAELQMRIDSVQPESVELLLVLGRAGEAVGECRAFVLAASDKAYPKAIELAARCLKRNDGNLGNANALLDLHVAGRTASGVAENPLFTTSPLADPVRLEAAAAPPPALDDWNGWLNRSLLLRWLDRPAESLAAAHAAFTACPVSSNSLQICANAIARPVLAVTRDTAFAQRLVDHLVFGAVGADGIRGTADDHEDPFAEAEKRLAFPAKPTAAAKPPQGAANPEITARQ
jgi:hypothetical protein